MASNRTSRQALGAVLFFALVIYFFRGRFTATRSSTAGFNDASIPFEEAPEVLEKPISLSKHVSVAYDNAVNLSDKAIVVASIKSADVSWVHDELPDWKPFVYVADDPYAPLTVQKNKGNEANVYLTFIIDNYDNLPATMVFSHHHNTAFHVDNAFATNAQSIRALNLKFVHRQGYASLRCMDEPGCICAPMRHWSLREENFEEAWTAMFPGERCPDVVLAPCCAQFAVSRAQVRARPRADYERYRAWLAGTPLADAISGRVMEYLWHIVFGREAVHCPDERRCYCDKFALCDADDRLAYQPPRGTQAGRRGFHPEDFAWLKDHKCEKRRPG